MYHWYLLAKESGSGEAATLQRERFKAGGGPKWSDTVPDHVRTRLFLLGAVECLPLALGLVFGGALEPRFSYSLTATCGAALTALLCLLLRRYAPPTVIHARRDGGERMAVARES